MLHKKSFIKHKLKYIESKIRKIRSFIIKDSIYRHIKLEVIESYYAIKCVLFYPYSFFKLKKFFKNQENFHIYLNISNKSKFKILKMQKINTYFNSNEFKNLARQSAYPPLLNPKNIDYSKIDSNFAWEANLPLPKTYKFIYVSPHGVGAMAFIKFANEMFASYTLDNKPNTNNGGGG